MIATSRSRRPRRRSTAAAAAAAAAISLLVIVAGASGSARAAKLLVLPASGQNVSAAIVANARAHVVARLRATQRFEIVDQFGPPTAAPPDAAEAVRHARAAGADAALTFHVVHDDDGRTVLILTQHRAAGGAGATAGPAPAAEDFRELLQGGPAELPAAVERLVLALAARWGAPAAGATVAPPPLQTAAEAQQQAQAMATARRAYERDLFVGVGIGPATMLNTAGGETRWLPWASLYIVKSASDMLWELSIDYATQNEAYARGVSGGFYLMLSPPGPGRFYVGVAAKLLWLRLGGVGSNGFAAEPAIGYWFPIGKPAPFLRVQIGYLANLFEEQGQDRLIPGSGASHVAHGPVTSVGVAF